MPLKQNSNSQAAVLKSQSKPPFLYVVGVLKPPFLRIRRYLRRYRRVQITVDSLTA